MQLNCDTEELRQMANLMLGNRIDELEKQTDSLRNTIDQKDARIAELELTLKTYQMEMQQMHEQILELTNKLKDTTLTTLTLHSFLVLELQKAKGYLSNVDSAARALLGHFIFQSIPDNAPQLLVESVRAMTKPERMVTTSLAIDANGVTMNSPQFSGPMYGISGNSNVSIGGTGNGE